VGINIYLCARKIFLPAELMVGGRSSMLSSFSCTKLYTFHFPHIFFSTSFAMTGRRLFFHSCVGVAALLSGAAAQVDNADADSAHEPDLIFKKNDLEWSEIELTPGTCDDYDQYCIDIPKKDEGETVDSLKQKFRNEYRLFSQGWIDHISADIEKRFDDYMSGNEVGICGTSPTVSSYALGVVVDNFYGMDFLNSKFKVRRLHPFYQFVWRRPTCHYYCS
jgi:hypothetical protein